MNTKKYPAPLYAVAGAGDYAYQQLRKLPGKLTELPIRVSELRGRIAPGQLAVRADLDHLRAVARRNAEHVLGEARTVYADLVARGERVVDAGSVTVLERVDAAEPAAAVEPETVAAAEAQPAAEVAPAADKAAKPAKRTRPAARK